MIGIVAGVADAIQLLTAAEQAVATIQPIVQKAQAEGRTQLTPDEWATITGADDSAELRLSKAIAAAKAVGK